jgi:vacuolar-type H+-ATPase subunit H
MERKEILEKLKLTEATIRDNIEQAQRERNEILAQAQKQAHTLEEDAERQIKAGRDALQAAVKKELEQERSRVVKKATADAEALKSKADVKKAKEFFMEQFKEYVHV